MTWLLVLVTLIAPTAGEPKVEDWASSPEAYFLTAAERQEWKKLTTEEARTQFRTDYWQRRDPTPGTDRNEFQEVVLSRIRAADARFAIGKTAGSRTARGRVFIVFGPPAAQRLTAGPLKSAPEVMGPGGRLGLPNEAFETREWHTWVYDREANSDLLTLLNVPSLEIAFIFEPGRRDELQDSSRFERWRQIVARQSIAEEKAR